MHGRKTVLLILLVLLLSVVARSQTAQSPDRLLDPLNVRPINKLAPQIDESQLVVLSGHTHPLATPENMVGEVSADQPMEKMVLLLRPDPSQEAALEQLTQAQHDPSSTYYHQWLDPETFGEHFGISPGDLARVANWLEMHGMKVEDIPASHRTIVFSGTAGLVESTFHTAMRKYLVQGQTHYANAADPSIPSALAEVVQGVVSLHDFHSKASQVMAAPLYTVSSTAHYLAPLDWDTIYDVSPLYAQGIDGTGESIAVLGRSDISLSDVQTFRSTFGLPAKNPTVITNGPDPGIPDPGDQTESTLDVEWAGAIAKNATVKFVTSKSTTTTDGIALSAQYAVANKVAPIVTLSYGSCEAGLGTSGNAFWNSLWAQAASQGQSVFVATGDAGAAGCDSPSESTATLGKGVNGLCSTPYSTCVGGTEFNDTANPGVYWASTNGTTGGSALSYIPELTWNESAATGELWSTGGGVSIVYPKPSWQAAPGVPNDKVRDVPDVAVTAAIHDSYIIEFQGDLYGVAGTSAATPSFASVIALVLQNAGSTQGNVNSCLYRLANQQLSAGGPAIFHDITSGNNSVPGVTGYNAGPGYDLVTGLGSVDAFMLVNHWGSNSTSNFSLVSSSSSLTVDGGNSSTVTLSEAAEGGFSSPVTLLASGAPSGMAVNFSSSTLTAAAPVTVTIAAASSTVAGAYTLVFSGSGGGFTRTLSLPVTVANPSFTLTANASSASVAPGSSATMTVTTAGVNGFNSAVALTVSGVPSGVTATLSPTSIASGSGSSTLKLSVATGAAAGTSTLTVTGKSGSITQIQIVALTVLGSFTLTSSATSASVARCGSVPITLTTVAGSGFNSAIALSISGVPSGVTASFSSSTIAAPGSGSRTLTLAAGSTAAGGTSTLTVTATGGGVTKTQTLGLTVLLPSFTLGLGAAGVSVAPGGSMPITVTTTGANAFSSAIALSVSGLPTGVTASFAPTSIATPGNGSSTLTLSAVSTAAAGSFTLTVTGTGGGVTATQTLALTVLASFTLSASATSASVARGGSIPIIITTAGAKGFSSAIALSISGLPSGVTASFAPSSIAAPGKGTSTLTLSAISTTAPGVYPLTVMATGGGVTVTQPFSLTVLTPAFTLTASATSVSVAPSRSVPVVISIAAMNGLPPEITLSVAGVPKGVTVGYTPSPVASAGTTMSGTLTFSAASRTTIGASTLTVTATGGGVTKTQTINLTVT